MFRIEPILLDFILIKVNTESVLDKKVKQPDGFK